MKTIKIAKDKCVSLRAWLYKAVNTRFSLDAAWLQNHIAACPRCTRRLAAAGRVNLAFSIIKSQPHNLNLLMRANTQAISVLKHSLRDAPKSVKLRAMLPEPRLLERCGKFKSSLANAAACLAILFLMKAGVFSSVTKFQTEGKKAAKNYYAANAGQDLADEVFSG